MTHPCPRRRKCKDGDGSKKDAFKANRSWADTKGENLKAPVRKGKKGDAGSNVSENWRRGRGARGWRAKGKCLRSGTLGASVST